MIRTGMVFAMLVSGLLVGCGGDDEDGGGSGGSAGAGASGGSAGSGGSGGSAGGSAGAAGATGGAAGSSGTAGASGGAAGAAGGAAGSAGSSAGAAGSGAGAAGQAGAAGSGGGSGDACADYSVGHCLWNDGSCQGHHPTGFNDLTKNVCNQSGTWVDGAACPRDGGWLGCCQNDAVKYVNCYYSGSATMLKSQCEGANGTWCD